MGSRTAFPKPLLLSKLPASWGVIWQKREVAHSEGKPGKRRAGGDSLWAVKHNGCTVDIAWGVEALRYHQRDCEIKANVAKCRLPSLTAEEVQSEQQNVGLAPGPWASPWLAKGQCGYWRAGRSYWKRTLPSSLPKFGSHLEQPLRCNEQNSFSSLPGLGQGPVVRLVGNVPGKASDQNVLFALYVLKRELNLKESGKPG